MPTNFKSPQNDVEVETKENSDSPGEDLAGVPEEDKDVCKQHYNGESHKFTERDASPPENSPSAGWRTVYYHMEVYLK